MPIEQIFEFERASGPPGRIRVCIPITGCFHDKTIISEKIFHWIVICRYSVAGGNVLYFPLPGSNHLPNLTPKYKILNVFRTYIANKKKTEQINFFNWLSNVKNLVLSNGSEYV